MNNGEHIESEMEVPYLQYVSQPKSASSPMGHFEGATFSQMSLASPDIDEFKNDKYIFEYGKEPDPIDIQESFSKARKPGYLGQLVVLSSRAHRRWYRDTSQLVATLLPPVLLGVIIGFNYYQLDEVRTSIDPS
jgi:hypothetical protein